MLEDQLYYYPNIYGQFKDEDVDLKAMTEGEESECDKEDPYKGEQAEGDFLHFQ